MFENCRKIRKLSAMLPDVIGTWKFEGNRGDPGGSGPGGVDLDTSVPEFTSVEELSVHELQPVSSPVSPVLREPIYLQANETPLQQTAAAVTTISTSAPSRTTILFDPATMERRNAGGKVCNTRAPSIIAAISSSPSSSSAVWLCRRCCDLLILSTDW